jgi:hypothetical protein
MTRENLFVLIVLSILIYLTLENHHRLIVLHATLEEPQLGMKVKLYKEVAFAKRVHTMKTVRALIVLMEHLVIPRQAFFYQKSLQNLDFGDQDQQKSNFGIVTDSH